MAFGKIEVKVFLTPDWPQRSFKMHLNDEFMRTKIYESNYYSD